MANKLVRARPTALATAGAPDQAILEFQSPTLSVIMRPVPFSARMTIWAISSLVVATLVLISVVPVDRVVSTPGVVLPQSPNVIVQPLETAIVRKIYVHEGDTVKKGQLLAELDPTFSNSDAKATESQLASLRAQVTRMRDELDNKPYFSDGTEYGQLEELAYLQRHQQFTFTMQDYDEKIKSLAAKVRLAAADVDSLTQQKGKLQMLANMRHELEHMQVGSKMNTAQAELDLETGEQKLDDARHALEGARNDLGSMVAERDGWKHQWYADTQTTESQQERLLSDMQGQATKNVLRRKLVEMRAPTDSIVLSVSRVSPGTVLQPGAELMTTVSVDSPLEIVAMVDAGSAGFVAPGQRVAIKFDTLPYDRYGFAIGHVERISADSFVNPTEGQTNPQATTPDMSAASPANTGTAPTYYYRVFVSIDQMKLRNPPRSFHIKPGMPLEVDVDVGKRTVLAYLFDRMLPFLDRGGKEPT